MIDVPWLNYMNTLVSALDASAQAKAAVGIGRAAPPGFALQAPGRPDAPELDGADPALEPTLNLARAEWGGAQAGFQVFQDWLAIINAYPAAHGLPIYISSTNTFQADPAVEPARNYPPGWLTNALAVINQEAQVKALCWFLDDFPHDPQWALFSLTSPRGRLIEAAEEFDKLLGPNTA
ncbi:MAG: hypothetical protein ACRDHL_03975 [Candidatus Promineifilaceae bacterium]